MEEFVQGTQLFFSQQEWTNLAKDVRHTYTKQYYIYYACIDLGINVVKPDFMQRELSQNNFSKRIRQTYTCVYCGLQAKNLKTMDAHVKICDKKVTSECALKLYNCSECGYATDTISQYNRHRRNHASDGKCKICNKVFTQKANLKAHMKSFHSNETKAHKCHLCPFETHWSTALIKHLNTTHSDTKKFSCEVCSKQFKHKKSYDAHMFTHKDTTELKFVCEYCDKAFGVRNQLQYHIKFVHVRSKLFKCNFCNYSTTFNHNLKIHEATHRKKDDKKDFAFFCEVCSKGFKSKYSHQAHMKSHEGNLTFICQSCPKKFANMSNLTRHVKLVHLKDTLYSCDVCPYQSTRKECVKSHKKTVHSVLGVISCEKCGYKSKNEILFDAHICKYGTRSEDDKKIVQNESNLI